MTRSFEELDTVTESIGTDIDASHYSGHSRIDDRFGEVVDAALDDEISVFASRAQALVLFGTRPQGTKESQLEMALLRRMSSISPAVTRTEAYSDENLLDPRAIHFIEYILGNGAVKDLGITKDNLALVVDSFLELCSAEEDTNSTLLRGLVETMLKGDLSTRTASRYGLRMSQADSMIRAFRLKVVRLSKRNKLSQEEMRSVTQEHILPVVYMPDENLPRLPRFLNELSQQDISEQLRLRQRDGEAIVRAIFAMNHPINVRTRTDDLATAILLAYEGQTDEQIGKALGTSRTSATTYLERMRKRTWKMVTENGLDPAATITAYVTAFREDRQDEMTDKNGQPIVYLRSKPIRKTDKEKPARVRPTPLTMSSIRKEPEPKPLFEQYRKSSVVDKYPVDEECPEFTTIWWDKKTLPTLYETFRRNESVNNPADIIRERADGTDKTRKPDTEVAKALSSLRKLARRSKTDFGNDEKKKLAFEMFTDLSNGSFNTLGDICRVFKEAYPDYEEYDVASILIDSLDDVLRDYQTVLTIQH